METDHIKRRQLLKSGLALTLCNYLPHGVGISLADESDIFHVSQVIYDQLFGLFGTQANVITRSDQITIRTPDIAENGAVVPISVEGKRGTVSAVALFALKNTQPLTAMCRLHASTDLPVSFRIKLGSTSEVYAIAQSEAGLIGTSKLIKITMGCMGG